MQSEFPISPTDVGLPPKFSAGWRKNQGAAIMRTLDTKKSTVLQICPTGFGKCGAAGTLVLMFDGSVRKIENIQVGDWVMGSDSRPREVLSTTVGRGQMYKVTPVKGESYVVNADHVLSLKLTTGGKHNDCGKTVNISVRDYLKKGKYWKHLAKGYRVGVRFSKREVPLEPYFLGLWLGDGTAASSAITTADEEIVAYLEELAEKYNLALRCAAKKNNKAATYFLSRGLGGGSAPQVITSVLKFLKVFGDKHIPGCYKINSRDVRLQLLAGYLDADGSHTNGCFEFSSESDRLANDVCFLARSLGFACYLSTCIKKDQNGIEGVYQRGLISGDTHLIPTKILRKQAQLRKQKKDVLVTGIKVTPCGEDNFYGFSLDGDHLFLMGDFTVTHNSLVYMATALLTMIKDFEGRSQPGRTLFLTSTKGLQDQLLNDFASCGLVDVRGRNSYRCVHEPMNTCEYGPCRIGFKCPDRDICEYEIAKRIAIGSRLVVTNYAYWLNVLHRGRGLGNFTNIVCDEAHDAPDAVASYLTTEFDLSKAYVRHAFGKSAPADEDNDGWMKKLEEVRARLEQEQSKIVGDITNFKLRTGIEDDDVVFDELELSKYDRRTLLERKRLLSDLERVTGSDEEWIFERTPGTVKAAPVWVADTARNLLFGRIPKRILSSASVSLKTAEMLGIKADECEVIEYPHTFPIENRMLIHLPTGRINKDATDLTMKRWLQQIDYIVRDRLDRKGIIHTVSYARRDMVMQHSAYKQFMITHERGNAPEIVRKFKSMPAPAILVSPVMSTGWDFPYGECEYQIIGKIAYPDTRSRIIQARTSQDKEYAAYLAMQQLVQACGRGVRTPSDRCENFIIDDSILWFMPKYYKFAPNWFREAFKKMLTSPKPPDKIVNS